METLDALRTLGQSMWLDYLGRDILATGRFEEMLRGGITGVTSNPTIFQKAISGSALYDEQLKGLVREGLKDEEELFQALVLEDIALAAELLRPVHLETNGTDGFVSLEVSPALAYDAEATVREAQRPWG
jgi:transaldolase